MIDAHIHLWRYSPATHGWIGPGMDALRGDFLVPELERVCARAGVEGVVAVQAAQSPAENEFLASCARASQRVLGIVGWVDLRSSAVDEELARFAALPRAVGLRHIVQDEPDERFLLQPDFLRGVGRLERHRLAYDILVYSRHLRTVIEFVDLFPRQRFVLDHLGKPRLRDGEHEPWAGALRELARRPNVAAKLSGLVTEDDPRGWSRDRVARAIDHALECFGPDRLMLGSDWPVCLLAAGHDDVLEHARSRLAGLSPDERQRVEAGTAAEVYGLARHGWTPGAGVR